MTEMSGAAANVAKNDMKNANLARRVCVRATRCEMECLLPAVPVAAVASNTATRCKPFGARELPRDVGAHAASRYKSAEPAWLAHELIEYMHSIAAAAMAMPTAAAAAAWRVSAHACRTRTSSGGNTACAAARG